MMQENFAQLKAYFREIGLTQEQMARMLDVKQAYISALLNGRQAFGKAQAEKWGEVFGISPSWLLTGEGTMLKSDGNSVNVENNSGNVAGNNIEVADSRMLSKALDEIAAQREEMSAQRKEFIAELADQRNRFTDELAELREERARLLNIIDKLSAK